MKSCERRGRDAHALFASVEATHERIVDALAASRVAYWKHADLSDSRLGLCKLPSYVALLSPQRAAAIADAHDELRFVAEGWQLLPSVADTDVVSQLWSLHADPQPLVDALARFLRTLLHGDNKLANIAVQAGDSSKVLLLDWALAAGGPPAIDLAWYLGLSAFCSPATKEATITRYAARLAHGLGGSFDAAWWQLQLGLALLGGLLRFGYWLAWLASRHPSEAWRAIAQTELCWWSTRARAGARRL